MILGSFQIFFEPLLNKIFKVLLMQLCNKVDTLPIWFYESQFG